MRVCLAWRRLETFERYVRHMKALAERVDSFHIVYFWGRPKLEWRKLFVFEKLNLEGYRNRYIRYCKSLASKGWLRSIPMYRQLRKIRPDVFFCLSGMQEPAYYFAQALNKPFIVYLRGDHYAVRRFTVSSWWSRHINDYLDTKFLKEADLIIPISNAMRRKAVEWGVDESKVSQPVRIGVDTLFFKRTRMRGSKVGYAGRLSPEKGVSRLFSLARQLPDIHFMIAGKNQMQNIFPLKLRNISYLGELPFSRMPWFYSVCNLIVLPSFTEGLPNVILEAYACGRPVLATPDAFPIEDLEVYGRVAPFREWAEILPAMLKDKRELQRLGAKARRYVAENFTWEKFGEQVAELLEDTVVREKLMLVSH